MAGYWNSPDLTFFSDLRVEMLGLEAACVRSSWHVTMSDGKTPHGRFTQRSEAPQPVPQTAKLPFLIQASVFFWPPVVKGFSLAARNLSAGRDSDRRMNSASLR